MILMTDKNVWSDVSIYFLHNKKKIYKNYTYFLRIKNQYIIEESAKSTHISCGTFAIQTNSFFFGRIRASALPVAKKILFLHTKTYFYYFNVAFDNTFYLTCSNFIFYLFIHFSLSLSLWKSPLWNYPPPLKPITPTTITTTRGPPEEKKKEKKKT